MNRKLLNMQRKELHDILLAVGVEVGQSKWTNDRKNWSSIPCDTLEIGRCYFLIAPYENTINIKCSPAPDGGVEFSEVNLDWDEVIAGFTSWARQAKRELDQEDPWAKYIKFSPPRDLSEFPDNSSFSYAEAQQAEAAIKKLITFLHEKVDGYSKQAEGHDAALNRLIGYAKSGLGRIDWSNQFVGLIIQICISLGLSPDKASQIWQFWLTTASKISQLLS